jgi:hypothetical protein
MTEIETAIVPVNERSEAYSPERDLEILKRSVGNRSAQEVLKLLYPKKAA